MHHKSLENKLDILLDDSDDEDQDDLLYFIESWKRKLSNSINTSQKTTSKITK